MDQALHNNVTVVVSMISFAIVLTFALMYMILERKKKTLIVVFLLLLGGFGWYFHQLHKLEQKRQQQVEDAVTKSVEPPSWARELPMKPVKLPPKHEASAPAKKKKPHYPVCQVVRPSIR